MNEFPFSSLKYTARRRMSSPDSRILGKTLIYFLLLLPLFLLILRLTGYVDYINAVVRECEAYLTTDYANALDNVGSPEFRDAYYAAFADAMATVPLPELPLLGCILALAVGFMMLVLRAGHILCCFKVSRREKVKIGNLFDGFRDFGRVAAVEFLRTLLVGVGYLLFIAPGFVLRYRYRFALRLLADKPELGPIDALKESAKLTRGHKWKLFLLDLSFILWHVLDLALCLVSTVPVVRLWVRPYTEVTLSLYYNDVVGWRIEDHPLEETTQDPEHGN